MQAGCIRVVAGCTGLRAVCRRRLGLRERREVPLRVAAERGEAR